MEKAALRALDAVESQAVADRTISRRRLMSVLERNTRPELHGDDPVTSWAASIRKLGRLTVNFHPDRISKAGVSVAEGQLTSGRYRPQAETGLSNGGRSAVPGGERTRWEQRLFGDAYEAANTTRPVYGALDLARDPHGGSPRFGSCYVVLDQACLDRSTFCVGDSHANPGDVGVLAEFHSIAAGLLEQGITRSGLDRGLGVPELVAVMEQRSETGPAARSLDGYVEAQIHGGISLQRDAVAIIADPSFRATETERHLDAVAIAYDLDLQWHEGSTIHVEDIAEHFTRPQGPAMAAQAARADGTIDANTIGRRAARIPYTPPSPRGDSPDSELQLVKYLWHCVLRHGRAAD